MLLNAIQLLAMISVFQYLKQGFISVGNTKTVICNPKISELELALSYPE